MSAGLFVYLATGWDNDHAASIKRVIVDAGHEYYHFLESGHELDYDRITPGLRSLNANAQAAALSHGMVGSAYRVNLDALDRADIFVLAEPASKGSFMEYGYALASGLLTILYVTPAYTIGVMDAGFDHVVSSESELASVLEKASRQAVVEWP